MATKQKEVEQEVTVKPVLAPYLMKIGDIGEKVEEAAGGLLAAIRKADIRSLGQFEEHILAAYNANKWNTRPGRPAKDRRNVPHTVRTYVWEIRSAYRAGIQVWRLKSMYDLRMARKRLKDREAAETTEVEEDVQVDVPAEVMQDLEGVRVLAPKQPNGALFHDLISTFIALPQDQRALFGRQLARLLHRYQAGMRQPRQAKAAAA